MINSDDSLFEEMTKQIENKQMEDEEGESKSETLKPTDDAMHMEGTLPDLTNQTNNNDTLTGLLLLGAGNNQSMVTHAVPQSHPSNNEGSMCHTVLTYMCSFFVLYFISSIGRSSSILDQFFVSTNTHSLPLHLRFKS